jgi:hypothetical protein
MKKDQKKSIITLSIGLLALIGTYNALMINSASLLSGTDAKKFKRLDEVYGVVTQGRAIAVEKNWVKLANNVKTEMVQSKLVGIQTNTAVDNKVSSEAAINQTLNLKLVEVMNPKKWENGVKEAEFNGSIATNNGIIESLNASLPEGMSIEISFSEMTGNTFEYDLNGEVYSGLMYQVDQSSFMITMTNGPLEGTRLRFAGEAIDSQTQQEQTESYLAENHNVEIGTFGEEMEASVVEAEVEAPTQMADASSFNFNQI